MKCLQLGTAMPETCASCPNRVSTGAGIQGPGHPAAMGSWGEMAGRGEGTHSWMTASRLLCAGVLQTVGIELNHWGYNIM